MSATTLVPAANADEARQRLIQLGEDLNSEFVERRDVIRTLTNSLVSRTHTFLLGPPGTAKSALIERTCARISGLPEGAYFRWLFTKFTDPNEVFGPPSLSALRQDSYQRVTRGKLPEALFAFCDEGFKGNSAILNSLLTVMNEREFFNGHERIQVPLRNMFIASNEMPQGEELSAMYDRLHFRHLVKELQSSSSFMHMLTLEWDPIPEHVVHIQDLDLAIVAANEINVPIEVFEALKTLRDELKKEGIEPTGRKFRECERIIRASAYLEGRDTAEIEDLGDLKHVLWNRSEELPYVARCVMSLANPLDAEAALLLDEINDLSREIDKLIAAGDSPNAIARSAVEYFGKMRKIKGEVEAINIKFKNSGRKSTVRDDLVTRYKDVKLTLQEKCFNVATVGDIESLD